MKPYKIARELFDEQLPALLRMLPAKREHPCGPSEVLHIRVLGTDAGEWTIDTSNGAPSCVRGLHGDPTRRLSIDSVDLLRLHEGRRDYTVIFDKNRDILVGFDLTPSALLTPEEAANGLLRGLDGTFIKVDHKQNLPTSGLGVYSFIEFGPLLQALGLMDRALDVAISEHSPGDFAQWATFGSGGWYTIDRIRFLVNNLQARLSAETLKVSLDYDALLLDIAFTSNNPTLEGQARAYLVWLFGIPLGWVDTAFPDINIPDFHIKLRLSPFVADGKIKLRDIGVEFEGTLQTSSIGDHASEQVRNGIRTAFSNVINTQEFRDGFASAIAALVQTKFSEPVKTWIEIWIDPTGIFARGTP